LFPASVFLNRLFPTDVLSDELVDLSRPLR